MAKKLKFYDDPQFNVNQAVHVKGPAVAASTITSKLVAFAATRILAVKAAIMVAGTNTAAGYALLNGTDTVGSVVCGTSTAGSVIEATITVANQDLVEDDVLDFKSLADSATLAAEFTVEQRTLLDTVGVTA